MTHWEKLCIFTYRKRENQTFNMKNNFRRPNLGIHVPACRKGALNRGLLYTMLQQYSIKEPLIEDCYTLHLIEYCYIHFQTYTIICMSENRCCRAHKAVPCIFLFTKSKLSAPPMTSVWTQRGRLWLRDDSCPLQAELNEKTALKLPSTYQLGFLQIFTLT